ncbi:uncharacterized protein N7459_003242 [Penicillium hispanicum]|uniref:uncharacterized protein n=1 Tax=Penicillium hispanicum TaxID=1080232 RepID=UPI00253FF40E|nr:uncharacterized protein N7459_003242 [Penicillium hispanicum]KAJ5587477.1 hypothetical protein N7459_003242 [Penicillium hispanicum]
MVARSRKQRASAKERRAIQRRHSASEGGPDVSESVPSPKVIDVEKLDLEKSYVGVYQPALVPQRPKQRRWKHTGDEPLKNLPKGWNADEPDLDHDDIEAQIQRCQERIEDNIMPEIFRKRLKTYQKRMNEKNALMAKYPTLSWAVIRRIEDLEDIKKWLKETNDKYELLDIATGIIKAYRTGTLDWNPGLVTYWAKGAQISQPRPFDWDEYTALANTYEGGKNFWVEGDSTARPGQTMRLEMTCYTPIQPNTFQNDLQLELRIQIAGTTEPGPRWPLTFIDDTGSDYMCIYDDDVDDIVDYYATYGICGIAPLMGPTYVAMPNGERFRCIVRSVWVNIFHPVVGREMASWDRIQCICWTHDPNVPNAPKRLNGPWIRSKLYTASAPQGGGNLWVFNNKSGFTERVPSVHNIPMPDRIHPVLTPNFT